MPERAFQQGETLQWLTIEGGMNSRRMVEYHHALSETAAVVVFGRQQYTALVAELSRPEPAKPPPFLPGWFEVPKPPPIPSEAELHQRLVTARTALARAQQHVRETQARVEEARTIADRAGQERDTARAALAVFDQHQRAAQHALEDALATGKPPPALNGHDGTSRGHLTDRLTMTETATNRFTAELSTANASLSDALASVRRHAQAVIAIMVEQSVEALRAQEATAAVTRAELIAVAAVWFAGAEQGPIRLAPAASRYLEMMPAWQDQPAVRIRMGGDQGRTRHWKALFSALIEDAQADFALKPED